MQPGKRFLYVGNNASYFILHRLHIARAFEHEGFDIHVAAPGVVDESAQQLVLNPVEKIQELGYTFHAIPFTRRGLNPLIEMRALVALYRLFRELRPDLVYTATIKPVAYGGVAARWARVPAVMHTITGLGYVFVGTGLKARLLRALVGRFYQLAFGHPNACVFFENPDDQATLVESGLVDIERTIVVGGAGVDVSKFTVTPERNGTSVPVVMLPSRMLWDKGIAEFVDAARQLNAQGVRARFVLVGGSDPGNPCAIPDEQLRAWHEEQTIEWWGWCQDMPGAYQQANIVCLPSYREGTPTVLVEAAASGRALIATDVPGCRQIVRHNDNGLLVPPRDTGALADAIKTLLENDVLRQRMATRARQIVESEFSTDIIASTKVSVALGLFNGGIPYRHSRVAKPGSKRR